MLQYRIIAGVASIVGVAAMVEPTIAQTTGAIDPLPWQAQATICGACLSLVGYCVTKVIPQIAKDHRASVESVSKELAAFRNDLNDHQKTNAELLREVITRK